MKKYSIASYLTISFSTPLLTIMNSCKKDEESGTNFTELVYTADVTNIGNETAIMGGNIKKGSSILAQERGICWSTSPNPTIANKRTQCGSGTGSFSCTLTDLSPNATYYVKAYVIDDFSAIYGNERCFTTSNQFVTVPCNLQQNSVYFNISTHTFYNISTSTTNVVYGNFGISANGMTSSFKIEFSKEPSTGYYTTAYNIFNIENKECVIHGVFGSQHFIALPYDTLYVNKAGNGKYNVTFCKVRFQNPYSSGYLESYGNITIE
jgi:hypothetical protein